MNLLTCLGTGNYKEARYRLGDEEVVTRQFGLAAARFVSAAKVYVALTAKAEDHPNWWELQTSLTEAGYEAIPVRIPDGRDEQEIWQVFSVIADAVEQEKELALDITHGFRTLPMMAMVLAAYLQASGGARICRVLYGAFEARNEETNVTPVFDLTSFLALYEWANALSLFQISGDSRRIADLLKRYDRTADRAILPREYYAAAKPLERLSVALALTRPEEIAEQSRKVINVLGGLSDGETAAAPFSRVAAKVAQKYHTLQSADLRGVLSMIKWYEEHGRYFQAVTLAREWLINVAGVRLRYSDLYNRALRGEVENALNSGTRAPDTSETPGTEEGSEVAETHRADQRLAGPEHEELRQVYSRLRDLRNDLVHCGYRECVHTPDTIQAKARLLSSSLYSVLEESDKVDASA